MLTNTFSQWVEVCTALTHYAIVPVQLAPAIKKNYVGKKRQIFAKNKKIASRRYSYISVTR